MTVHDQTIAKIRHLPDALAQEVSDFVDYLIWKQSAKESSLWLQSEESQEIVESDFSNYLSNLEDYENRLARGEIQW